MSVPDYERLMLERRCTHCEVGTPCGVYSGGDYLRALESHRGEDAVRLARHVEPFFWGDADIIRVMLCRACADELGIEEPRQESADDPTRTCERGRRRARSRETSLGES